MRHAAALALSLLIGTSSSGATPDNDATCDIAVLPAATLLLPYFEVDLDDRLGENTLFTITNVTDVEQIAHVVVWTDYGFPGIDFNIFLTGYDTQSISLYDLLARGEMAPPFGTGYEDVGSPEGLFSSDSRNPLVDERTCRNLPMQLDAQWRERLRRIFTTGVVPFATIYGPACDSVGGVHENAIGWITIDAVRTCEFSYPIEEAKFLETLLYDNVFTGDYQQLNSQQGYAQGGPLVHIRAVPEGGGKTPFAETFYDAYLSEGNRGRDARQPLPSTFAARWTDGGALETKLKIWQQSDSGARQCGEWQRNAASRLTDVARFDADGRPATFDDDDLPALPATALVDAGDRRVIPPSDGMSGWTYLNFGKQAWVITSMRAEGRYSADFEATAFGNGCSPVPESGAEIAPAPDFNSRRAGISNDDTCDIAVLPAATLLLPYFEVDLYGSLTTLFTVTNTTDTPRIASVTLWTDYAYPIATFGIPLGGWESRTINLADVLRSGIVPSCEGSPSRLDAGAITRMQQAFTLGRLGECRMAGAEHHDNHARGYATIDVATICASLDPTRPEYYAAVIAFDNVLTGDYQQVEPAENLGHGGPLVHIRAIPDGGGDSALPDTFYARFQSRPRDARQPLPSRFVARWINSGTGSFETSFTIWLNAATGANATCRDYQKNAALTAAEYVSFDDQENAIGQAPSQGPCTCPVDGLEVRAAGQYPLDYDSEFPLHDDATAGWMYLNLNDWDWNLGAVPRQAWVTYTMRAEFRYSVEADATALGNGCSAGVEESEVNRGRETIGPSPNRKPEP